jgi:hypothetical protein
MRSRSHHLRRDWPLTAKALKGVVAAKYATPPLFPYHVCTSGRSTGYEHPLQVLGIAHVRFGVLPRTLHYLFVRTSFYGAVTGQNANRHRSVEKYFCKFWNPVLDGTMFPAVLPVCQYFVFCSTCQDQRCDSSSRVLKSVPDNYNGVMRSLWFEAITCHSILT